jgi:TraM recognition site of TraD and TraG
MRQDLKARQPFCLIDFHGSLFENVKAWCAFNGYFDRRIILLDLSGGKFLKGCSFFRRQAGLDVGVQSSGMVESVLRVSGLQSPDAYPVIYKLSKILFTVIIEKDIPLTQGFQLFANRRAFSDVVSELSDPLVKALWSDLESLTQSEWSRQVTPTVNKLYRLVQSKAIQRALCVNTAGYNLELTFRDIILVNLATSGELDSDAARVFAALFINHFYHSAKRRIGRAGKSPLPYYLYIDEWWLTPTPDIGRILAETRKFGLLLALANQDLSQIKASFGAEFTQSILTLCQVQCCFGGLNFTDASRLAHEWGVEAQAVQGLAERQCLVKLPRLRVSSITVPDVREPFVRPERMDEFEMRIGRQTGALPVEEVDALLARTAKEPARKRIDDTIDGYAVI